MNLISTPYMQSYPHLAGDTRTLYFHPYSKFSLAFIRIPHKSPEITCILFDENKIAHVNIFA